MNSISAPPYCVGLTGTIASGKSTVAILFREQGINVFCADDIAKSLTTPDAPAFNPIVKYFGPKALTEEKTLNRRYLRARIIHHPKEKAWLEALLHPLIRHAIQAAILTATSPYTVIDIPLLYDRTQYPFLNRVLLITTPPAQQIERLIKRDNCTRSEAEALLALQLNADIKKQGVDDIIHNETTLNALKMQVLTLHQQYKQHIS